MNQDPHFGRDAAEIADRLGALADRFSGKNILLTGSAGFLGLQFVHFFLHLNDSGRLLKPCRITALDNYQRGYPPLLKALESRPDLALQQADVVQYQDFGSPDFIIHAASIASPTYYRQYPIETMDANVLGLRNLLDHARRQPPESLLFFSSSEIYGDPDPAHIPTTEDYRGFVSCTGPRACYDESKRFGETLCVNFWRVHHVRVKMARPFNNYGPGLRLGDRRVIPDLFRDVLADRNLTLLSDGRATRTFCYATDALNGYLRLLLSQENGEAFNIGVAQPEISMRELAEQVVAVSGRRLRVITGRSDDREYLTDNPQRRCPSIEKARQSLGYEPVVDLRTGLERMYAFYLDHSEE